MESNLNDKFKDVPLFHAKPKVIKISNAMFGTPVEIVIHDTLMVVKDDYHNKYFSLIDLKNYQQISRFGEKGKGPNEIMFPANVNFINDSLEFTISNPTRYVRIAKRDLLSLDSLKTLDVQEIKIPDSWAQNLIWFPAMRKFIANGMFHEGKYAIIGIDSNTPNFIGFLPNSPYINEIENFLLCDAYQGYIKPRPDGKMVAHVSLMSDLIDVINTQGEIKSRFQTYHPEVKVENGMLGTSRNSPYGFSSMALTNQYIYALYSGRTFNDYALAAEFGEKLYVFDWDLNPVCSYILPVEALSIAVTQCNSKLYFTGMGDTQMDLYELVLQH